MTNKQHEDRTYHIDLDLLYLEAQDYCPYQTKNETGVPINNIFCTNTFQSNLKKACNLQYNLFVRGSKVSVHAVQFNKPLHFEFSSATA